MKVNFVILFVFILIASLLQAYEPLSLLDSPTAGILQRGEASVYSKIYRQNGLLAGARVGLFPRFMFGVSFGGEQVVGNDEPQWHDWIEFFAKYRILDESETYPALTIGFSSEGHGQWHSQMRRYDIKSKGFYLVASRSYRLMGSLGIHAGVNYSMELEDEDRDLSGFIGFDKSIGPNVTLMGEYDLAFNDSGEKTLEETEFEAAGHGYLNAGLRIRFSDGFFVKLMAYDLLENSPTTVGMDRAILLEHTFSFQ